MRAGRRLGAVSNIMQHSNGTLDTLTTCPSVEYCRFLIRAKGSADDKREVRGELIL